MIVLDTHIFIFIHLEPAALRSEYAVAVANPDNYPFLIPAISLVEIAQLVAKGRLEIPDPLEIWFDKALASPVFEIVPITPAIASEAYALPGEFHRDPADRLIVATARVLKAELMTDDGPIRAYPHVSTFGRI